MGEAKPAAGTTPPRIGRYAITGRIGRGGMGMVYRGYDAALEREVAIKTLTAQGNFDEESRKRFEIEAKAAAKLQHPNIVTVFELGQHRGAPFIAMELLSGMDLETLLRSSEPLLLQEKLDIVAQLCRGLAYAHEHHVVHRDVKPSNMRVLDDGTVKIVDFGIAKLAGIGVTRTGMIVGTVHYMSPEQVRGEPLDGRSDVFSAGAILYEVLSGRRPFSGDTASVVIGRIVHDEPAPLPPELGEWTPQLQEIVSRALAKQPPQRYATADEMADALSALAHALGSLSVKGAGAAEQETVVVARRLLREGRLEECERRLQQVLDQDVLSLDARRTLRAVRRLRRERQRALEHSEPQQFPELDATFQAAPTVQHAGSEFVDPTVLQGAANVPTVVAAENQGTVLIAPPTRSFPTLAVVAGALAAGLLLAVSTWLVARSPKTPPEAAPSQPTAVAAAAPSALSRLALETDPPGASVVLDGRALAGVTPLTLEIERGRTHVARIERLGYVAQEMTIDPAAPLEPKLMLRLEPQPAAGSVAIRSSYPVEITWRGRALPRSAAGRFELPPGRHALTLTSAAHHFRSNVEVEIQSGQERVLTAPGLGRLSVRAAPDNCQVFLDGVFLDYPPILEKPVSAGRRTVGFRWPDGTRSELNVEVVAGAPAFVLGRKDQP